MTTRKKVQPLIDHLSFEAFLDQETERLAITYLLLLVGENVSRLYKEFREAHPAMPWSQVVGLRNRIVHVSFDLDQQTVYQAARDHLPGLRNFVRKVLKEEYGDDV